MSRNAARPVFAILSALVEERMGLYYGPDEHELFLDRVNTRAQEAGFDSLLDYYYFLRYDAQGSQELTELGAHLVVGETFFFRELEPLRLIVNRFVQPRVQAGQRPRIWSAACATGEEPLTLAMLLAEAGLLSKVDLIASDVSERALARARAGRFSRRSLRQHTDVTLAPRWIREEGDKLCVSDDLIRTIDWRRINLCAPAEVGTVGMCDVILCRNVLIYFREETVSRVIETLATNMTADAALFVGVSESLLQFGTALSCEEADQVFFYRKPT
jgi:chemotaxis protein methyltransferase CheR